MPAARNHTLDHIKAIACLTIVCHHLAFYGPMTDVLRPVLPALLLTCLPRRLAAVPDEDTAQSHLTLALALVQAGVVVNIMLAVIAR